MEDIEEVTINLEIDEDLERFLDKAAYLNGMTLSEFIMDSALNRANFILLNTHIIPGEETK